MILLHGVGYTYGGNNWLRTLEALGAHRRVIAPDIMGWGTGDRLLQSYSFGYLVDFVREFQDALSIDRADVVGHSMGGWVASLLAYESPERVNRLVLVDSGGLASRQISEMTEFQPPTPQDVINDVQLRFPTEDVETQKAIALEEQANIAATDSLTSYRKLLGHMMNPETRVRYNTRRRLPLVRHRAKIIWGERDSVNPAAMAKEMVQLLPNAELTLLDCGHFPYSEVPDEFNETLNAFLAN